MRERILTMAVIKLVYGKYFILQGDKYEKNINGKYAFYKFGGLWQHA